MDRTRWMVTGIALLLAIMFGTLTAVVCSNIAQHEAEAGQALAAVQTDGTVTNVHFRGDDRILTVDVGGADPAQVTVADWELEGIVAGDQVTLWDTTRLDLPHAGQYDPWVARPPSMSPFGLMVAALFLFVAAALSTVVAVSGVVAASERRRLAPEPA